MKLLIDDANIAKIKTIYQYYPIDGVTTNPTILAKSGRNPYEVLKEIRAFIGNEAELHAQVISRDAEGMVKEARKMAEILGKNTYIKVPTIPEGLKAMKALSAEGFKITAGRLMVGIQLERSLKSTVSILILLHFCKNKPDTVLNLGIFGGYFACGKHLIESLAEALATCQKHSIIHIRNQARGV